MGPRPGSANRLPPLHSMAVDQSARVINTGDPLVSAAPPPLDMSKLQDVRLFRRRTVSLRAHCVPDTDTVSSLVRTLSPKRRVSLFDALFPLCCMCLCMSACLYMPAPSISLSVPQPRARPAAVTGR